MRDLKKSYIRRNTHKYSMTSSAYGEHKQEIAFTHPMQLTNEFFKRTSFANIQEAAAIIYRVYAEDFGAKNTPMGEALSSIIKNPEKVPDGQAIFGVEQPKKSMAVYSIKVTTMRETSIFSLRVAGFMEISYARNGELVERHYQKGKEVIHEVFA
jgi:hypothetical protein